MSAPASPFGELLAVAEDVYMFAAEANDPPTAGRPGDIEGRRHALNARVKSAYDTCLGTGDDGLAADWQDRILVLRRVLRAGLQASGVRDFGEWSARFDDARERADQLRIRSDARTAAVAAAVEYQPLRLAGDDIPKDLLGAATAAHELAFMAWHVAGCFRRLLTPGAVHPAQLNDSTTGRVVKEWPPLFPNACGSTVEAVEWLDDCYARCVAAVGPVHNELVLASEPYTDGTFEALCACDAAARYADRVRSKVDWLVRRGSREYGGWLGGHAPPAALRDHWEGVIHVYLNECREAFDDLPSHDRISIAILREGVRTAAARNRAGSTGDRRPAEGGTPGGPKPAAVRRDGPPDDGRPPPKLNGRRMLILRRMYALKAFGEGSKVARDEVAAKVDPTKDGTGLGRDFAALRALGLTDSGVGPEGGVWLTDLGRSKAAELAAEQS